MGHVLLEGGDLSVVVGDNEAGEGDLSVHRAGYNGVWSLTSRHCPQNCFVSSSGGLNLEHLMDDLFMTEEGGDIFEPRHLPMTLTQVSAAAATLTHAPSPLTGIASETRFALVAPHAVDMTFRATLHRPPRAGRRFGFFWASYLHAPDSPSLCFVDATGLWSGLNPDEHGNTGGNTVCHESAAEPFFGDRARQYRAGSLTHSASVRRFSRPLMYGRPGDGAMLFLLMFDQAERVRLCMSPSGGGIDRDKRAYNPAWDFQYVVDDPEVGAEYGLGCRLVYKPYVSRDEVEALYAEWIERLGGNA
jgi:hypothetical protein